MRGSAVVIRWRGTRPEVEHKPVQIRCAACGGRKSVRSPSTLCRQCMDVKNLVDSALRISHWGVLFYGQ